MHKHLVRIAVLVLGITHARGDKVKWREHFHHLFVVAKKAGVVFVNRQARGQTQNHAQHSKQQMKTQIAPPFGNRTTLHAPHIRQSRGDIHQHPQQKLPRHQARRFMRIGAHHIGEHVSVYVHLVME